MNTNTIAARVNAKDLFPGQLFIYNFAGGNRTVYRAVRVQSGAGRTAITYTVEGSDLGASEFTTASLSSLVLV